MIDWLLLEKEVVIVDSDVSNGELSTVPMYNLQ